MSAVLHNSWNPNFVFYSICIKVAISWGDHTYLFIFSIPSVYRTLIDCNLIYFYFFLLPCFLWNRYLDDDESFITNSPTRNVLVAGLDHAITTAELEESLCPNGEIVVSFESIFEWCNQDGCISHHATDWVFIIDQFICNYLNENDSALTFDVW